MLRNSDKLGAKLRKAARAAITALSMPLFRLTFWLYRRFDLRSEIRAIAAAAGVDVLPRHYYSPVPDADDFGADFWNNRSQLTGLNLNAEAALELLDKVVLKYIGEFR